MTSTQEVDAMTWFGERGFEYWNTGGNCAAFGRHLDDGKSYILISHVDGGRPPVVGETIMVGLHNEVEHPDGVYADASTFEEAIEKANALIEKYVKS